MIQPPTNTVHAIDLSPGDGVRLFTLASHLSIPKHHLWAIAGSSREYELASDKIGHVLKTTPQGLDLPPGAVSIALADIQDQDQLQIATRILIPHGILIACLPDRYNRVHTIGPNWGQYEKPPTFTIKPLTIKYLTSNYTRVYLVEDMGLVIGARLPIDDSSRSSWNFHVKKSDDLKDYYQLPASRGFRTFKRTRPSDEEIERSLSEILKSVAQDAPVATISGRVAPIMPLSTGHMGLVLASGILDGIMTLSDGRTVVIKGLAWKTEYKKDVLETSKGKNKTRETIYQESVTMKLRCIDSDGVITDYID